MDTLSLLKSWYQALSSAQKKKEKRKVHGVSPLLCPAVNPKVKFYGRYNGTKERNIKKASWNISIFSFLFSNFKKKLNNGMLKIWRPND